MSNASLHIKKALAHEHSALTHEDKYANNMKSAGGELLEAFKLALLESPGYHGKDLSDKAIINIYKSNLPRPWWYTLLNEARKDVTAESNKRWGMRVIQWHINPDAAELTRAKHTLANAKKRLQSKPTSPATYPGIRKQKPLTDEVMVKAGMAVQAMHDELIPAELPYLNTRNAAFACVFRIRGCIRTATSEQLNFILETLQALLDALG